PYERLQWRWGPVTGEATGGATITGYEYRVSRGRSVVLGWEPGEPDRWYDAAELGLDVEGDADYLIEVRAKNDAPNRDGSRGKVSDPGRASVFVQLPPLPGRPGPVKITDVTTDSVGFTWERGEEHGFDTFYQYRVVINGRQREWRDT